MVRFRQQKVEKDLVQVMVAWGGMVGMAAAAAMDGPLG